MIADPIILPEFARLDYNNGFAGGASVLEPNNLKKDTGWMYGEEPDREYFNWLARYTYLNLQYLKQQNNEVNMYFQGQW